MAVALVGTDIPERCRFCSRFLFVHALYLSFTGLEFHFLAPYIQHSPQAVTKVLHTSMDYFALHDLTSL